MVGMPKLKRRLHTQGGLWLTDLAMQDGLAGTPFCTPKLRMSVELRSLYTSDFTCIGPPPEMENISQFKPLFSKGSTLCRYVRCTLLIFQNLHASLLSLSRGSHLIIANYPPSTS